MFPYQKVHELNRLELLVYKYIVGNLNEVENMTIRDLAGEAHVSTTTILRFLKKMNYGGFSEFKIALKQNQNYPTRIFNDSSVEPIQNFFKVVVQEGTFDKKINQAARMINVADLVLFFGVGNSARIAQYGASLLSSYGIYSLPIVDPFQPEPLSDRDFSKTLLIVVSVSGETKQSLQQARYYKESGAATIALTANSYSALNQIVDFSISYDVPQIRNGQINVTTQVPLVYILEQIASNAYHKMIEQPRNDSATDLTDDE
ncbi:MurR/RpiR family transcriptional regulator [Companilactobacillus jidongensis]|uniref:MurR/RpiR family transcriptional regulator n=1 Tax=Companilactobacillus jidongensis TaxID=2486006 RepID=UPI000F7B87B3|nr:MurR/RpiR family transcriptional regulator [Companilactobacillus jidongensis]